MKSPKNRRVSSAITLIGIKVAQKETWPGLVGIVDGPQWQGLSYGAQFVRTSHITRRVDTSRQEVIHKD